MALMFDGAGYVVIPEWQPTTADWDIILEASLHGNLSEFASDGIFEGNQDNGGRDFLRIRNRENADFQFRTNGGYDYMLIPAGARDERNTYEFQSRVDGSNVERLEVYMQGDPTLLGFSDRQGLSNYTVHAIGYAEGRPAAAGSVYHRVQLIDNAAPSNSRDYRFDDGSGTTLTDSGPLGNHGTLINFTDVSSAWLSSGPSITTASNIINESQPATFTLSDHEDAPTGITINGEAGSNIAFVSEDTEAGTETYSYLPPLIADDAEAELSVSVDGDTLTTTISYANSYDRDQLTHPATEAEYSTNSLSYPNAYGTSLPYEWKVITDASSDVVVIDWDALEADDGFFKDIAGYATPVANGSTTVTLGVFVPETGEAYQFDRTINVSDGSVVVEGQGLWRELFRDPTEELFTELFR